MTPRQIRTWSELLALSLSAETARSLLLRLAKARSGLEALLEALDILEVELRARVLDEVIRDAALLDLELDEEPIIVPPDIETMVATALERARRS